MWAGGPWALHTMATLVGWLEGKQAEAGGPKVVQAGVTVVGWLEAEWASPGDLLVCTVLLLPR